MRKIAVLIYTFLIFSINIFAHSGKPKYHIIIDTDGSIDDMRSLSMFLAGNEIRTLAISCSEGTLMPDSVYTKVKSLLAAFHCEGVPVGIFSKTDVKLPASVSFAQNIHWNKNTFTDTINKTGSVSLLNEITADYKQKITLIALGSLKTYADWIKKNPAATTKIDRIIWYNSHDIKEGFNYQVSPESFEYIKNSGVTLDIVSNSSGKLLVNNNYLNNLKKCNSIYARKIINFHNQAIIEDKISGNNLELENDLVPLFLTVPLIFETESDSNIEFVSLNNGVPENYINETIAQLLISTIQTNNRVFNAFPIDTTLYLPEYAKIVNPTIEKYGLIEWKAVVMTNEIHGHTGIYSIIGAKMGIRAMEYFNIGINDMQITTYAGNNPPLSCFNDGVQISTGSTIGQGLITISDSISDIPSSVFEFNKNKVIISVKKEIADQMQRDISYGVKTYGLLSNKYWLYIEKLALKYWTDFDRHEIFVIKKIHE